jgi:ATP-dependent DNA helicase RecQ
MQKYDILKTIFGHSAFRPFQEEAVDAITSGQDLLTILPTGGGKSLCYQLPSLMMDGVTIVISPLIALMHDQVNGLIKQGIEAGYVNSSQSMDEAREVMEGVRVGKIKLLYIAPERLSAYGFLEELRGLNINFFVVDEAHCVSEWGHEFRSDYRRLHLLKDMFPTTTIAAFTATATPKVADDIASSLKLNTPKRLRATTFRDNLFIRAQKRVGDGKKQLLGFVKQFNNECGIVYTFSRKESESVAAFLVRQGIKAAAYHAGMSNEDRHQVYHDFLHENVTTVVATIAFGMGIDKSNIRYVAHTSLPKTVENYYQEIGRAGRDGLPSQTLLIYAKSDEMKRKEMLDTIEDANYKRVIWKKQEQIYQLASGSLCRHQAIAHYFGDELDACDTQCDICQKGEVVQLDITLEAQKVISAIYRTEQKFGATHVINVLRGSSEQKILQFGHDRLSVYGIGSDRSKNDWKEIIDRLFELEALSRGEFHNLVILSTGFSILKKEQVVMIDEDRLGVTFDDHTEEIQTSIYDQEYLAFKALRREIATKEDVPAYIIFSDKTLMELAERLPQNEEEFLAINGVGALKNEKYGKVFLELSQSFQSVKENRPKPLGATHIATFEEVSKGATIMQVAKDRELTEGTIFDHIARLHAHKKIDDAQMVRYKNELYEGVPKEVIQWYQEGLQLSDQDTLHRYLGLLKRITQVDV